jgi:hypothetical protein
MAAQPLSVRSAALPAVALDMRPAQALSWLERVLFQNSRQNYRLELSQV